MGGRYGGDPKKRRKPKTPWQVSYAVLEAIGRASMIDVEKVGAKTRKALNTGLHIAKHGSNQARDSHGNPIRGEGSEPAP